ncbi:helix-turn-helix domain-containing protein [Kitasatospora sp. NPDC057965]|uniref:helix-turn-helix domain-containing protein n=1 Tax=Kitasatospora sp. NPDC057965 TaxID=3346291 RepID=UPI0036DAF44F
MAERTLRGVAALAEAVVEVGLAPLGLDAPVTGLEVFDRAEPGADPGTLLVAVGLDPRSERAVALVRAAGRDRAAGVVFREEGAGPPNDALRTAADEAGTALLFRRTWADWAQLIGTLRAGLAVAEEAEAANVPLGDLDALAEALAALVGGAVTIESPDSRVLAYSSNNRDVDDIRRSTILARRVPAERRAAMREDGFYALLRRTPGALHRRADGTAPERAAVAVRAGEEVLGSLWVAPTGCPLPPTVTEALRAAARIAAPHLLHDRARRTGQRELVLEAARALLAGRGSADVLAARTGLPPAEPCAVLALALAPGPDPRPSGAAPVSGGRLARSAHAACARRGHAAVAVAADGGARVLLGGLERDPRQAAARLSRLAGALAPELSAELGRPVRIGIGEVRAALDRAADSCRTAEQALRALRLGRSPNPPPAAGIGELADTVALLTALDALRAHLAPAPESSVARLVAHAAKPGEEVLLDTLRAYLEHAGDSARAAAALAVPASTFRYRKQKAEKVCGIDLDDPDARLLAQLHLRLLALDAAERD